MVELVVFILVIAGILAILGLRGLSFSWRKTVAQPVHKSATVRTAKPDAPPASVSFAPPEFEWSGHSISTLPLKTLTYKQYECLEDARYGFRIIGRPPSERDRVSPLKTRVHGLKTVASLHKHGFLGLDGVGASEVGYVITDLGLNALEVCNVRY